MKFNLCETLEVIQILVIFTLVAGGYFFYLAMPDFLAVTVGGSPIAITFTSDIANIAYHLTFLAAISYSCIP